ncbi:MAG TPA: TetR/AcrR family transcriptional regulator [Methylocystis sp.]|nr:TetR/AcrR family transcriptional regulator [Methylocystis sp.]
MTEKQLQPAKARRALLRERLIDAAEAAVERGGLAALKAREIALGAGCALGAIYTAFEDLDELILCVNQRTLAQLEKALATGGADGDELRRLGAEYLAYARAEAPRWRALFEHRMPEKPLPEWYARDLDRLFGLLEAPLQRLLPEEPAEALRAKARTLFSAVHGIVLLGLEEKLQPTPASALDAELSAFIATFERGLR